MTKQKLAGVSELNKGEVQLSGETSFYKADGERSDEGKKGKSMADIQKAFNLSKKSDDPLNIISDIGSRENTAFRLSKTSFGQRTKSTTNMKPNPYFSKGFKESELFSATN